MSFVTLPTTRVTVLQFCGPLLPYSDETGQLNNFVPRYDTKKEKHIRVWVALNKSAGPTSLMTLPRTRVTVSDFSGPLLSDSNETGQLNDFHSEA